MKLDRGDVNFLRTSIAGSRRCPPNGSVGGRLTVAAPWWLFQIGLSATTIASSFGKVVSQDKALEEYRPQDIALSLVRMVSYNIAQVSTRSQQRSTASDAQFCATSGQPRRSFGIRPPSSLTVVSGIFRHAPIATSCCCAIRGVPVGCLS
jgi:hypothetical protein